MKKSGLCHPSEENIFLAHHYIREHQANCSAFKACMTWKMPLSQQSPQHPLWSLSTKPHVPAPLWSFIYAFAPFIRSSWGTCPSLF